MSSSAVHAVGEADRSRVVATVVSAFIADPVERWLYPEASAYLTHFGPFVDAFGGGAFERQTVWMVDDLSAVAMWLPPGVEVNGDAIVAVMSNSVAAEKHADAFSVLEQMDVAHPTEPHWYLPWLGVDCARQGAGLGSRLLADGLTRVDADHMPAFLETPNPRTVPLYERHGFRVIHISQAGGCPPMTSMLRPAQ